MPKDEQQAVEWFRKAAEKTDLTDREKRAAAKAKISSGVAKLKALFESGRMFVDSPADLGKGPPAVKKMKKKPPPNVTIKQAMKELFPTREDLMKTLHRLNAETPNDFLASGLKIQQMAIKMREKMMARGGGR